VRALQLIVLFGKDNWPCETGLFLKIFFVDRRLGQIRLDIIELAHVPATTALRAETALFTMVHEVDLGEFSHGLIERRADGLLSFGDDLVASGRMELLRIFVHLLVEIGALIQLTFGLG
jgi:hypothetical protein